MAIIREPAEKDLMHVTKYAVENTWISIDSSEPEGAERLRKRKEWAADHLFNEHSDQRLLVAEEGDRTVGYVYGETVEEEGRTVGKVKEIYVDEFYRREGVGSELIQSMFKWMRDKDVDTIENMNPSDDERAQGFLNSIGFSPDGIFSPDGRRDV
ncbi:GNAT family N-acetyltransferase [Halobacillus campisalis]|uniref:GNAT family N-acetyltransferase n=1 Tax=Halobacillus campisalis TaxID=435909 RepID=A0ABW2K5J1_9BACI|nr:GNAT family N-acetyltransferase [Halobacillus campisalis]